MRDYAPPVVRVLAALLVFLLSLGSAAQAGAQDDSPVGHVDALIEQGVQLREAGRDEEAAVVFRRARALEDSSRTRAQLGLALLAAGAFVEAYELLELVLAASDPWVEARRAALEASFASARAQVGTLELVGAPGGLVRVNGIERGLAPVAPVHVVAGRAVVEVSRDGFHTYIGEVMVEGGGRSRLRIDLIPQAATTPGGPGGASGEPDWLWPVVVTGGVLVIGAVVTGLAIGLQQPTFERSDVGGVVHTLVVEL